ncbi:MAG TPA: hypothetical protein VKN18_17310 [Blastocatellia bacterium]|nr:hypothetical protein [Blastocatellia bacterium]
MLFRKRLRQQEADFDHIGDELLLSLKLSEDEIEFEIDEIVSSPDFFAGIQSRIRERRTYQAQTVFNQIADRRMIATGMDIVPSFLVPYRSPRWVLTAVVVLLVVATGLLMVLPKKTKDQVQNIEATIPMPVPPIENVGPPAPVLVDPEKPQSELNPIVEARKPRLHRNTLPQSRFDEIATEFFPLTFAAEPISSEGGHLVRVTIPRSALVAMGLPMNVDRATEHVRADVFIGDDGLARAIRFIQ